MEAQVKTIRNILDSSSRFLVPFFQRSYSWRKSQWNRLWDDVEQLRSNLHKDEHFLGPLVCTLHSATPGELPAYMLIDVNNA